MSAREGLRVQVVYDGERVCAVSPVLTRVAGGITRLLQGRPPEQGLMLIQQLFSICSRAHMVAGSRALARARGHCPDAATQQQYEAALAAERIREAALRLFSGWGFAGDRQEAGRELLARVNRLQGTAAPAQSAASDTQALAELWQDLGGDEQSRRRWIRERSAQWHGIRLGPGIAALTPALEPGIEQALAADSDGCFCAAPALSGNCYMTGPASGLSAATDGAQYIAGVLAALFVQLDADIQWLQQGGAVAETGAGGSLPGSGCGWALSARGWLLHRVVLSGDRVRSWQILAPTDWNFHPRGVLYRRLLGVRVAASQLQPLVNDLILSVDPCVSFEVSISHA